MYIPTGVYICDLLWEKVQFRASIDFFLLCMNIQ